MIVLNNILMASLSMSIRASHCELSDVSGKQKAGPSHVGVPMVDVEPAIQYTRVYLHVVFGHSTPLHVSNTPREIDNLQDGRAVNSQHCTSWESAISRRRPFSSSCFRGLEFVLFSSDTTPKLPYSTSSQCSDLTCEIERIDTANAYLHGRSTKPSDLRCSAQESRKFGLKCR